MFARLILLAAVLAASPALASPREDVQQEIADWKLCEEWAPLAIGARQARGLPGGEFKDVVTECLARVASTMGAARRRPAIIIED
jgi:hypothetical protein